MTSRRFARHDVRRLAVVVPACNEEQHLAACLDSIRRALSHGGVRGLRSLIVVVVDQCTDDTAGVARSHLRPHDLLIETSLRNVGSARALGSAAALERLAPNHSDGRHTWLSHTDADSQVPPGWLARQLRVAARADAVAGVVRVDGWSEHRAGTRSAFETTYRTGSRLNFGFGAHPHVHGANLGVRADAYLDAGGFEPLDCGEDHALWRAVQATGRPTVASRRLCVVTSGRRTGRAKGGFADTLDGLLTQSPSGISETVQ